MSKIKISMCPDCKGKGRYGVVLPDNSETVIIKPCSECKGTGKIIK